MAIGWQGNRKVGRARPSALVYLAPMANARDTDKLGRVVDNLHDAPVTYADAPLIFVAFQLFAACGPWCIAQRVHFAHDTGQHFVRQRFEFLSRRRLDLNSVVTHVADRASLDPL